MRFALLLVWVLLSCIWADAQGTVYRDNKYPISLIYGSEWEVAISSQPMIRLKLARKQSSGFADFAIVVNSVPKAIHNWSSDKYAVETAKLPEVMEEVMQLANPTAKLVSSGTTYVHNKKAVFSLGDAKLRSLDQELDIKLYSLLLLFEGYVYAITFRADRENYEEAFKDFRSLISTVVINPKQLEKVIRPTP